MRWICTLWICLFVVSSVVAAPEWPRMIEGVDAPAPGEHPRLLFRSSDVPRLRALAQTPEGKALVARLRATLNGSDGRSLPVSYNPEIGPVDSDGAGDFHDQAPLGTYTFSHMAGYGMLYQLTGDPLYADLGWQAFQKAQRGYRDRDRRYAWIAPYGSLRAGPVLGWTALGYDLCYPGWDEATRREVCLAIASYDQSEKSSLEALAGGSMPPFSNHFGMQVGGAGLALLAILNDPWVDSERISRLLEVNRKALLRNLTEGFGDGGFFAEGDGTGSMSSHIVFLTALQAWKHTLGVDFITPRPNAPWTTLKYLYLTIPRNGRMDFWPIRGGYPHNVWQRDDKSGAGYFSLGFGALTAEQQQAMLWLYNEHLRERDADNQTPFDTPSPYPHFAVASLVNWPWLLDARNPAEVLPHGYFDTTWELAVFRNRWQDENDMVVSVQMQDAKGYIQAPSDGAVHIAVSGTKQTWGRLKGDVVYRNLSDDGSGVIQVADGTCLLVDCSPATGTEGVLVMSGPGAGEGLRVQLGAQTLQFLLFPEEGNVPFLRTDGTRVRIGERIYRVENGRIAVRSMP